MTARDNTMSDFLVLGAQRCATSWLYFCLKEHPEVFMPYIKEIGYFTTHHDKGVDWYRRYYKQRAGQKAAGDVTPNYIFHEKAAERIAAELPDAKLIVTFRNPSERAFSQYLKHVRAGAVKGDFEAALKENDQYVKRGFYFSQLERYLKLFPKERLLVLLYEDIQADPRTHLKRIFSFIGVDENFVPSSAARVVPSEDLATGMMAPMSGATGFLRKSGMGWAVDVMKKSPLLPLADKIRQRFGAAPKKAERSRAVEKTAMSPETRARLNALFAEENEKLGKYLGRDLSFWR